MSGDHGVVEEGVSAYPKEVTHQMVHNFLNGGAAINVFSRHADADVFVVDMGVDYVFKKSQGLIIKKVGRGTKNFIKEPAMLIDQAVKSIEEGIQLAEDAMSKGYDFLAVGDMGIGNTTTSAAVMCSYLKLPPEKVIGYGTGINSEIWAKKVQTVERALAFHKPKSPLDILSKVGGFEIGGIAGVILGGAAKGIPVVVDGYVATAGACIAFGLSHNAKEYVFFSHKSAEKGHDLILRKLEVEPILDLGMRLGEGTGAVLAMFLIEAAIKAYNEMSTFGEANVSEEL